MEAEQQHEEEEDYMSDAFLKQMSDVCPGVPMVKRVREARRREAQQQEKNLENRQLSYREREEQHRDAALHSSISCSNKGFTLLHKMGYTAGRGLGKHGSGRVEPIPLNIKTDRGGIGMEEQKKRKAEEELEEYSRKVLMKKHMEKKSIEDFRERKRVEREKQQTEGDLRRSQRACQQLDTQKGITTPRDSWYWPEAETDKEAECGEENKSNTEEADDDDGDDDDDDDDGDDDDGDDEELTPLEKLQFVTSYLRSMHYYCTWCGTAYNDEEDLNSNCPGDTAADHDD